MISGTVLKTKIGSKLTEIHSFSWKLGRTGETGEKWGGGAKILFFEFAEIHENIQRIKDAPDFCASFDVLITRIGSELRKLHSFSWGGAPQNWGDWGDWGAFRNKFITFERGEIHKWFQRRKDAPEFYASNAVLIIAFRSELQKIHPFSWSGLPKTGEKWGDWGGLPNYLNNFWSRRDAQIIPT